MKKSIYTYAMILMIAGCNIFGMDKSFIEQAKELKNEHIKRIASLRQDPLLYSDIVMCDLCEMHSHELAALVRKFGDQISDKKKLHNLIGDHFYHDRKEIIKNMIEKKNIHPNSIKFQINKTPLEQSIIFEDIEFYHYLFERGVQHTKATRKLLDENPSFLTRINRKKIYQLTSEELAQLRKELKENDKRWESSKKLGLSWWMESGDGECEYREKRAIYNKFGMNIEEVEFDMQNFDEKEIAFGCANR